MNINVNINLNEPDEEVPVGDHIGLYELSIMMNKHAWALDEEDGDFEEAVAENLIRLAPEVLKKALFFLLFHLTCVIMCVCVCSVGGASVSLN